MLFENLIVRVKVVLEASQTAVMTLGMCEMLGVGASASAEGVGEIEE